MNTCKLINNGTEQNNLIKAMFSSFYANAYLILLLYLLTSDISVTYS